MPEPHKRSRFFDLPVLIIVAAVLTGCFGWALAFTPQARDHQALALIAAAIAFGSVANALWRR